MAYTIQWLVLAVIHFTELLVASRFFVKSECSKAPCMCAIKTLAMDNITAVPENV